MTQVKIILILVLIVFITKLGICEKKSGMPFTMQYSDTNKTLLKIVLLDSLTKDTIYTLMELNLREGENQFKKRIQYNYPKSTNIFEVDAGLYNLEYEEPLLEIIDLIAENILIRSNNLNTMIVTVKGGTLLFVLGKDSSRHSNYPVRIYREGDRNSVLIPFDSSRTNYMPIGKYDCTVHTNAPYKVTLTITSNAIYEVQLQLLGRLVLRDFDSFSQVKLYTKDGYDKINWSMTDNALLLNPNGIELLPGYYYLSWVNDVGLKKRKEFIIKSETKFIIENK